MEMFYCVLVVGLRRGVWERKVDKGVVVRIEWFFWDREVFNVIWVILVVFVVGGLGEVLVWLGSFFFSGRWLGGCVSIGKDMW